MNRVSTPGIAALLVASLAAIISCAGCSSRASAGLRVYDVSHQDWHYWDDREETSYRQYVKTQRQEYREFAFRSRVQQNDYWKWRHDHGGNSRT